jgi:F420-non-reducing hydrogenase small subunit
MKLATLCLTSCTGCHINLLHLHEKFIDILGKVDLVFSPVLVDVKEIQACDVAIIEGSVRNREDYKKLHALREKSRLLISMGTCANYGGITGLGNSYSVSDLLQKTYNSKENTRNPGFQPRTLLVDDVVKVDYYIPGCPPPPEVLSQFFDALFLGKEPPVNLLPVCAECNRSIKGEFSSTIKRTYEEEVDDEECLLQQGFTCLGSVTRAGCGALCTSNGAACLGCRGPTQRMMLEPSHGIFRDLADRRCHYLGISLDESEKQMRPFLKSFYNFSLGSTFLRKKRSERVAEQTYRVNLDKETFGGD